MKKIIFTLGMALLAVSSLQAATSQSDIAAMIKQKLAHLIPGQEPDSIAPSPVDGLYQVVYGAQVFYMSKDGKYLIQGDILDLDKRKSITQDAARAGRKKLLAAVDDKDAIIFAPKGKTKHTITVFTDIDCPYCTKLHREREALNKAGVAIRYLFFPRAGLGSPSFRKAVSVWCAKDRKKALTEAKLERKVEPKTCDNPVKEQMQLGEEVGVSGTPAIVLEDGSMIPGYRPAADLIKVVEAHSQQ